MGLLSPLQLDFVPRIGAGTPLQGTVRLDIARRWIFARWVLDSIVNADDLDKLVREWQAKDSEYAVLGASAGGDRHWRIHAQYPLTEDADAEQELASYFKRTKRELTKRLGRSPVGWSIAVMGVTCGEYKPVPGRRGEPREFDAYLSWGD